MNKAAPIVFTSEELNDFQKIWFDHFGEKISVKNASLLASDLVSMLLALTQGESLEVRCINTALVTSNNNLLKHD